MQIKLNGKIHALSKPLSVQELSQQLDVGQTQVAIERNREIVPRSRWNEVMVDAGDEIEIVRFVGGG